MLGGGELVCLGFLQTCRFPPDFFSGVLVQIRLLDRAGAREWECFLGGVDLLFAQCRAQASYGPPPQRGYVERRGPAAGSGLPICPAFWL